jgi:cell division protein FtsL
MKKHTLHQRGYLKDMNEELIIVLAAYVAQIIGFIITVVTKWTRQDNRILNLETKSTENEIADKELQVEVKSLSRLYSKIEIIETKQISQSDAMNATLTSLNISITHLNNKLDMFAENYNKLNTDVEIIKSKL